MPRSRHITEAFNAHWLAVRVRRKPHHYTGLSLGCHYYKVTEKVDAEGLSSADIAALGTVHQLVMMKTVAHQPENPS